jgi:predicted permease
VPWIALTIGLAMMLGAAFARRDKAHAKRTSRAVLRAIIYVIVPPVAFLNITRLDLSAGVGAEIVIGWAALAITGALSYLIARRVLRLDHPAAGVLVNAGLASNTTYLGLPAVAVLFGSHALGDAVVYNQLIAGPTLYLGVFGVGAALGTRGAKRWRERARTFVTRNPPLLAVLAGLAAPNVLAPDAMVDASHILIFACLPLGFFAVGVTLAGQARHTRPRLSTSHSLRVATALVLRVIMSPLLLLALSAPFIHIPSSYLLLAAMPVAVNTLAVAHEYGLDHHLAASCIAWSTGLFLLIALAYSLHAANGEDLIGLLAIALTAAAMTARLTTHAPVIARLASHRNTNPRPTVPTVCQSPQTHGARA